MDAIAAAREMLPPWVVWGNALWYPLLAFVLSLFGAWLGVWIASRPQRRLTPDAPWTERARRTFPARLAGRRIALLAFLAFGVLAFVFSGPCNRLPPGILGLLGGAAGYAAATCIRWRVARRVGFGASGLRVWLRGLLADGLIYNPYPLLAFLLFILLPDRLDAMAVSIFVIAAALFMFFAWGGGLVLARASGLSRPADERLRTIVETAAAKTGIRPRAVYEIVSTTTNAAAFALSKRLLFTESILKELDEDELMAVCVHELGHLTEPLPVVLGRLSPLLFYLAIGAIRLILAVGGVTAFTVLNIIGLLMVILLNRLSQRMERRADRIASSDEAAKVYARALEKIYQANLIPAVLHGRLATHPHLYDRLLAAGVTPAYERPRPPSQWSAMMAFFVPSLVLIGVLAIGGVALRFALLRTPMHGSEPAVLTLLALGGDASDLTRLAYLHYLRDDKEGAAILYRAVTELDPNSVYGPANLAITLAALDRCEEADKAAAEAARRYRKNGSSAANRRLLESAASALIYCKEQRKIARNAVLPDEDEAGP